MSRLTSSFTCQLISVVITTLIIHNNSFTLSPQDQNLPFQQIIPTLDFFYLLDCLHNNGTVPCDGLSWLYPSAFYCTLNTHYRIVSYRIVSAMGNVRIPINHTVTMMVLMVHNESENDRQWQKESSEVRRRVGNNNNTGDIADMLLQSCVYNDVTQAVIDRRLMDAARLKLPSTAVCLQQPQSTQQLSNCGAQQWSTIACRPAMP